MKHLFNILVFLFLLVSAGSAHAQTNAPSDTYNPGLNSKGEFIDSFYYMKDDGIFSDEEKDEEAMHIYQRCNGNYLRRLYYDCSCIAGQFRLERDVGELVPQSIILNKVYNGRNTPCANTVNIAGNSYSKCLTYTASMRKLATEENNEEYCTCVANKFALDFTKKPLLNLRYIENMQTDSMMECERKI